MKNNLIKILRTKNQDVISTKSYTKISTATKHQNNQMST